MIERLSHGPASVHGLTEPFALSQQMISKHIAYLVRARIVIKTKRGRESVCTLRPEAIKKVSDWAAYYRRFWEESFDKLDVVVGPEGFYFAFLQDGFSRGRKISLLHENAGWPGVLECW